MAPSSAMPQQYMQMQSYGYASQTSRGYCSESCYPPFDSPSSVATGGFSCISPTAQFGGAMHGGKVQFPAAPQMMQQMAQQQQQQQQYFSAPQSPVYAVPPPQMAAVSSAAYGRNESGGGYHPQQQQFDNFSMYGGNNGMSARQHVANGRFGGPM